MNVIELTQALVRQPSVSRWSNVAITDYLEEQLRGLECQIERLEYTDPEGERKASLVAKLGQGSGGLAFCSHSDTVPGQEEDWDPFDPRIDGELMYGRGSADMKGPLAATIIAASQIDPGKLKKPVYIVITSDEETGLIGARYVKDHSQMLRGDRPEWGIIAEPTKMIPVYAHKGYAEVKVTALGEAAHTSTDKGISATFLLAPFMAEIAQLAADTKKDPLYMNPEFDPPTNGFNITVDDGNCATNVTSPKTTCTITFRTMPEARSDEILEQIVGRAEHYGFATETIYAEALFVPKDSRLVEECLRLTGLPKAETVPYGTDGAELREVIDQLVIMGPGDIQVAHRVNENVPLAELHQAVDVYRQLIESLCY
ncbi:MAG: M20/M25/M40 family metallo-hydrolase [Ardenticatenales bacterium]|nr:M20/M25/M40 family metallo-hydrolase [Ardenticatenales bacterium]